MPLPIRDGNQSLTTLSTILVGNAHIPAHSVVSLGSQAITDIATAVSGVELGPNTISALENISVTFGVGTSITIGNVVSVTGGLTNAELRASVVTIGGGVYLADAQVVLGGNAPAEAVQIGGYNLADNKLYPIHVDDLGVQTIKGAVTASIIGTPSVTFTQASVTFGTAVVTGSVSVSNLPVTQTVTFTQASVTFGQASVTFTTPTVTGSVSVLNLPATQTVTFSQASVTFGTAVVTGSASILNFPVTQAVTFGTAVITGSTSIVGTPSVTFTTATITGSTSILNFPASQTVTFTTAPVTFGTSVVTGSVSVLNIPATQTVTFTTATITGSTSILNFPVTQTVTFTQASVTFGVTTGSVSVLNFPVTQGISGTVTVGNSVTIGSLPAISGTVTANVQAGQYTTISQGQFSIGSNSGTILISNYPNGVIFSIQINTNNSTYKLQKSGALPDFGSPVDVEITDIFSGSKTTSINTLGETKTYFFKKDHTFNEGYIRLLYVSGSGSTVQFRVDAFSEGYWNQVIPVSISSVTIGSLPAISGTVTANGGTILVKRTDSGAVTIGYLPIGDSSWSGQSGAVVVMGGADDGAVPVHLTSVAGLSLEQVTGSLPISGTVTANNPSGALTTRFGSVVTANLATLTSAVTNTSRKYLLVQNIATSTVTIGIGFAPTTTQGIQLPAGGGLTFDAFCPTGAVYWLSSVTGSNWSILEG